MRMWMVDPRLMCRKHLMGEHVECHMFEGTLAQRKSVTGYIARGLFEPNHLHARHDALAMEMTRRGYNHASPMRMTPAELLALLPEGQRSATVDREANLTELSNRCPLCRSNQERK